MSWRRSVEKALSAVKLTLAQWFVLDATSELIASSRDAVSQNDVAARTDIDRMTVSQVMRNLERAGLVDRGPDFEGRAYRIVVTKKGQRVLHGARARVDGASTAWIRERARSRSPKAQGKISRST